MQQRQNRTRRKEREEEFFPLFPGPPPPFSLKWGLRPQRKWGGRPPYAKLKIFDQKISLKILISKFDISLMIKCYTFVLFLHPVGKQNACRKRIRKKKKGGRNTGCCIFGGKLEERRGNSSRVQKKRKYALPPLQAERCRKEQKALFVLFFFLSFSLSPFAGKKKTVPSPIHVFSLL